MEFPNRRRRHADETLSKFEQWVYANGGAACVGAKLGVHEVTVFKWLRRNSMPSLPFVCRILDLSQGKITAADILEATEP